MRTHITMPALLVALLMCGSGLRADESANGGATASLSDAPTQLASLGDLYQDEDAESDVDAPVDGTANAYKTPIWMNNPCVECQAVPPDSWLAVRLGGWGVITTGSKALVGEWAGLQDWSLFYDVDGLTSNGQQTADFFITGPEGRSNMAGLDFYYGPGLQAEFGYRRFLHRLGYDPVGGPALPNGFAPEGGFYIPPLPNGTDGYVLTGGGNATGKDLVNAGDDYAIRVQQFQADVGGRLGQNVRWQVNFWGLKKEGTRQANAQQHCYSQNPAPAGRSCHVTSQGQRIDWLTMEVEPVIEAKLGFLTVEYSRTMRSFQQDDQIALADFTGPPFGSYGLGAVGAYAYVPENFTAIDRFKMRAQLGANTDMYVMGLVGNTHNKFRQSDRKFYGVDARLTNRTFDGLSVVVYGKTHTQNNSADTVALDDRYPGNPYWLEDVPPQEFYLDPPDNNYLGLVDRRWFRAGVKSRWRPFYDSCGLANRFALVGGYQWSEIRRDGVEYELDNLGPFTQPTTVNNMFFAGMEQDWSYRLSTYLRYRMTATSWPLVGVTERQQLSLDAAINSNQPEHEGRIEMGGTWNLADDFMVTGSFWLQNRYNHSQYVNFSEQNYPLTLALWYAPNECWSLSAGYANLTNWIDQDITLGREDGGGGELTAFTSPWNYTGRSDVVTLAANYAASQYMRYNCRAEYVSFENYFDTPPTPAGAVSYADIPTYSAVLGQIWRLGAGFDYLVNQNMNAYFRYDFYDYDGFTMAYNSGTAHMFLVGLTGTF